MKKTSLYNIHTSLGAKMVPFAGYDMPVSYSGITEEHNAVRNAAGVFDVSHMGEFMVEGPDALALIQKTTSNDASKLFPGRVQYSTIPNEEGGIVDDLLVYQMSEEKFMLVVNASNIEKDWNWFQHYAQGLNCRLDNVSDNMSLLAVQGPKATEILQKLTDIQLSEIEYYHFRMGTIGGVDEVIISATGYTGSGGFELYIKNEDAEKVWNAVFEAGKAEGIKPAGLGCRDTLRLEMGFCLYGNDINDTTSPIEAGLGWVTKFTKDFVGREIIEGHKTNGVTRKLVGLEISDRSIARQHAEIVDAQGAVIGEITSGTTTPTLQKSIAMGYVPTALSKPGSEVMIRIRNKDVKATVVKMPFYQPSK